MDGKKIEIDNFDSLKLAELAELYTPYSMNFIKNDYLQGRLNYRVTVHGKVWQVFRLMKNDGKYEEKFLHSVHLRKGLLSCSCNENFRGTSCLHILTVWNETKFDSKVLNILPRWRRNYEIVQC